MLEIRRRPNRVTLILDDRTGRLEVSLFEETFQQHRDIAVALRRPGVKEFSLPSAVNAVLDALATRGISRLDLPMTPQRVWSALHRDTAPARDPPTKPCT